MESVCQNSDNDRHDRGRNIRRHSLQLSLFAWESEASDDGGYNNIRISSMRIRWIGERKVHTGTGRKNKARQWDRDTQFLSTRLESRKSLLKIIFNLSSTVDEIVTADYLDESLSIQISLLQREWLARLTPVQHVEPQILFLLLLNHYGSASS